MCSNGNGSVELTVFLLSLLYFMRLKIAAEWNPDLSSRYRTNMAIGRPRKRWLKKMKTQSREAIKPTKPGSTLPKTVEDGLY